MVTGGQFTVALDEALDVGASMDHRASADLARVAIDRARSTLDLESP